MAVSNTLKYLLQEVLYQTWWETLIVIELPKELGQVCIAVLLDEVDVIVKHDSVFHMHDVLVFEFHQDSNLSDRGRGDPIVAIVDVSLLDGILFASLAMATSVDAAVGATAELAQLLVFIELGVAFRIRRLLVVCFNHQMSVLSSLS